MSLLENSKYSLRKPKQPGLSNKKRQLISNLLMAAGLIVIVFPLLTEVYGYAVQARLSGNWERKLARQERLAAVAEAEQIDRLGDGAVSAESTVLEDAVGSVKAARSSEFPETKIKIPKIGLDQVVGSDVDPETLKNGPGHYRGTANPGQSGTVGIAGHRVTYTHPFNRVDELAPGDPIILETLDSIFEYRVVRSDILEPDDISALVPKGDGIARLTLTTCTPKYSARYRLDVQASLVKATKRLEPTILERLAERITRPPVETPRNALDLAIEQARRAVAADPNNVTVRINLGQVYKNLGRHAKAIGQFERAIALDSENPAARFQLAAVYIKTGETSGAISSLERAISAAPGFEPAHYRLGQLYLRTKQPEKAIEVFTRALALQPLAGDTHYDLGRAYEKLGDIKRAKAAYRQAVKYVPDMPEAVAALKRVSR